MKQFIFGSLLRRWLSKENGRNGMQFIRAESSKDLETNLTPNRRRFRLVISLRAMMLVPIVAVLAAWIVDRARAIRHAIETIEINNYVLLDSPLDDSGKWKSRVHPPRWLYDSLGKEYFAEVEAVAINNIRVHSLDPEVIQAIETLPGLIRLELSDTWQDADLEKISKLTNIKDIKIDAQSYLGTPYPTGTGMRECWPYPGDGLKSPTESLRQLSRMKKLQRINIGYMFPADASVLDALATLPYLCPCGSQDGLAFKTPS